MNIHFAPLKNKKMARWPFFLKLKNSFIITCLSVKEKYEIDIFFFSQGRLKSGFPESASSNALSASLLSKTFPPIRSNPTLVAEIRPYIFKKEN
ncbi:hypothetical protein [Neisseria weaveri]|uniref:hypothetical protein n=1 Tax=Neisseria weaveri TaxID=28091 RepID=UPI0012E845B7|nr:hypothetical protein [Neisseria weaveri]